MFIPVPKSSDLGYIMVRATVACCVVQILRRVGETPYSHEGASGHSDTRQMFFLEYRPGR